MQFSYDMTLFVTSCLDGWVRLFDTATLQLLQSWNAERPLNSASISPLPHCPYTIAGGGQDAMSVTTTASKQGKFETIFFDHCFSDELGCIAGHFGPVNTLAFAPHGRAYTSGGEDGNPPPYPLSTPPMPPFLPPAVTPPSLHPSLYPLPIPLPPPPPQVRMGTSGSITWTRIFLKRFRRMRRLWECSRIRGAERGGLGEAGKSKVDKAGAMVFIPKSKKSRCYTYSYTVQSFNNDSRIQRNAESGWVFCGSLPNTALVDLLFFIRKNL